MASDKPTVVRFDDRRRCVVQLGDKANRQAAQQQPGDRRMAQSVDGRAVDARRRLSQDPRPCARNRPQLKATSLSAHLGREPMQREFTDHTNGHISTDAAFLRHFEEWHSRDLSGHIQAR
jgi:hypothetical protein